MFQIIFLYLDKCKTERVMGYLGTELGTEDKKDLFYSILSMLVSEMEITHIINLITTVTFEGKLFTPSQILWYP